MGKAVRTDVGKALRPVAGERAVPKERVFRIKPWRVVLYVALSLGTVVMVAPMVWMVITAFKSEAEARAYPPTWWPQQPVFENVLNLFTFSTYFPRWIFNSVVVAIAVVGLQLFTSALVGYVFAKMEFPGRDIIFVALLSTMMLPGAVTLVPHFQMVVWLHMLNTYPGLIVPSAFTVFGIFLMRQQMHAIPDELIHVARIDGASEIGIFFRIVLPLMVPGLSALGIFAFLGSWDSFLWPVIVTTSNDMYTLPIGLAIYSAETENYGRYSLTMAGALVAVLPTILVYLFFQKKIVEGITLTGMGGQ